MGRWSRSRDFKGLKKHHLWQTCVLQWKSGFTLGKIHILVVGGRCSLHPSQCEGALQNGSGVSLIRTTWCHPVGKRECKQTFHLWNCRYYHPGRYTAVTNIEAQWPSGCALGFSEAPLACPDGSSCLLGRKVRHGFPQQVSHPQPLRRHLYLLSAREYTELLVMRIIKTMSGKCYLKVSSVHWRFKGSGQTKSGP